MKDDREMSDLDLEDVAAGGGAKGASCTACRVLLESGACDEPAPAGRRAVRANRRPR